MANEFINLPATSGNGSGAWTDVSAMGAEKTIVVGGALVGTVNIEISNEAAATKGAPVKSFNGRGGATITVAAKWMRATVVGYKSGGAPDVDVGANDDGTDILNLAVTASNGVGAAANSAALPLTKTVTVGGPFKGSVLIEYSEDAGTTWAPWCMFTAPGSQTARLACDRMRVTRSGVAAGAVPGTPLVDIGACDDTSTDPAFSDVTIDDSLDLGGRLLLSGDITPAALAANADDWAPAGFATAYDVRASGTAARNITGLAGGAPGRRVRIMNVGAFDLTLTNLDGASVAANQFSFVGAFAHVIPPRGAVELQYDGTASLWRRCDDTSQYVGAAGAAGNPTFRFASEASGFYLGLAGRIYVDLVGQLYYGFSAAAFFTANQAGFRNSGPQFFEGVISPAQIVANTNNYNPAGFGTSHTLRLSTDASRNITGMAAPSVGGVGEGQEIQILNVGAQDIVFKNLDGASAVGNQFKMIADVTVPAGGSISFLYDLTLSKWCCTAKNIT